MIQLYRTGQLPIAVSWLWRWVPGVVLGALAAQCLVAAAPNPSPVATPASKLSNYSDPAGAVPDLQKRIDRGEVQLKFEAEHGYLLSLLDALRVPQMSQLLVYSKTSCQRERISPQTPRAVYFNDRAYVAWLPGSALLEISSVDPKFGAVFYTLDQKPSDKPQLVRRDQCLECHTGSATLNVPGFLVRSYATDDRGVIDITSGCSMVDHRTPLPERWGGWYVCGSVGSVHHRGNLAAGLDLATPASSATAAPVALNRVTELSHYLQPNSDIVALLVLEHQAHMQNLLTRLQYESTRKSLPLGGAGPEKDTIEALLKYLLFVDEVALSTPIQGSSSFTSWFESQGPRDKQGRSLRQLDLQTRLFKFPCSYMIYSDAFEALPRDARLHLYHRLWNILNGEESDPAFQRIPAAARRAILEILIETKTDVPISWKLGV